MKNLVNLLPLVLLATTTIVFAGEEVDESLKVNNAKSVSIENLRGLVKIQGSQGNEVTVVGELDEKAEGLTFEQSGSRINIKVNMPHSQHNKWHQEGSQLTITVPESLRVNFKGVSSNVEIEGIENNVDIQTVSGDIVAQDLTQQIELVTVSGDIDSKNLSGKIRLSSVSGNISDKNSSGRAYYKNISGDLDIQSSANEISAKAVSGSIELLLGDIDELIASTVSGDLRSKLSLNDNGLIKMSSVSGDLTVDFQGDVNASFKLKASAGGDIVNNLTKDKVKRAKYGPGAKLLFEKGDGEGSVRANTVSGTIEVK